MRIAVASGKGGTGKTTVAVSLALSVAGESGSVQFLDCDVEEPNAALLLKPVLDSRQEVGTLIPEVDLAHCTFCGRCAEVCAYHAIAVISPQVLTFSQLCHGCGSCTLVCPATAIREVLYPLGRLESGHAGAITFAQGTLNVGEAMSPPIIRQLKRRCMNEGLESVVILDAPPGTSCPVVETMRGADVALLVTEPTPFGLHDLRLAVQVARDVLDLPVGVVINRDRQAADGVRDTGVDAYCAAERVPIWMRIPHDRRIAEAYSEGMSLVEAMPAWREPFRELYWQIKQAVDNRRTNDLGQVRYETTRDSQR